MKYEIKGGNFPVVTCTLSSGEQMITEKGSMVWMSANIDMETQGGGLGKMFSKAFSGESMFQNIYTARGDDHLWFQFSRPDHSASGKPRPGDDPAKERLPGIRNRG